MRAGTSMERGCAAADSQGRSSAYSELVLVVEAKRGVGARRDVEAAALPAQEGTEWMKRVQLGSAAGGAALTWHVAALCLSVGAMDVLGAEGPTGCDAVPPARPFTRCERTCSSSR